MKRLKKTLSCILALLVLLTTIPFGGITVFASEIDRGDIVLDTPVTAVIEESDDVSVFSFTPAESGIYRFYSDCEYDTYGAIYDMQGNQLAGNDDDPYSCNFAVIYEMKAGTTYRLHARFLGSDTGEFAVAVEKYVPKVIESITFHNVTVIEGDGTLQETYDEELDQTISWLRYDYYCRYTVHYSDGTSLDSSDTWIRDDKDEYSLFTADDQSHLSPWGAGKHTVTVTIDALDIADSFTVEVVEGPIQSVTVDDIVQIENTNGLYKTDRVWDEETGTRVETPEYYYYSRLHPRNPVITLKDGTVIEESEFVWNGERYSINYFYDQSYDNRWTAGNTYKIDAEICGYTFSYDVSIIETPVASVTVDTVVLLENVNGYYRTDWVWDEESDQEVETPEYFYYNGLYPRNPVITLKDGTEIEGDGFEWNGQHYSINYAQDQSYDNQWTVGNTYQVTATVCGYTFTYDIQIDDSPVASVTPGKVVRVENQQGYYTTDFVWDEESGQEVETPEYFYYEGLYPYDSVITMKDGSTYEGAGFWWNGEWHSIRHDYVQSYETRLLPGNTYVFSATVGGCDFTYTVEIVANPIASVTVAPITFIENTNGHYRTDPMDWNEETNMPNRTPEYFYYDDSYPHDAVITLKDGTVIEDTAFEWNGNWYEIGYYDDQCYENRWTAGNTYQVRATLCGFEFTYDVSIIETPVASVTVDPIRLMENTGGNYQIDWIWDEEAGQEVATPEYYCYNELYPRNLIITLKDGTVIEDGSFEWNGETYWLNYSSDQSYETRWTAGNTYTVSATIAGFDFTYDAEITTPPVIELDTVQTVTIANGGEIGVFNFTPDESGAYLFQSFSEQDTYGYIYDANGNCLADDDDGGEGNNFVVGYTLDAGVTYQLRARYYSDFNTGSFDVIVTKSPVVSVTSETITRIEHVGGHYTTGSVLNEETGEWIEYEYYYYSNNLHPRNMVITLKDGTVIEGSGFEWNGQWYGCSNLYFTQDYYNQWTVGNTYPISAAICGYEFTYGIEIVESPVASVTADSVVRAENSNGYYTSSEIWSEEEGCYVSSPEYFYYYDITPYNSMVITLKDGTTFNGGGFDWQGEWYSVQHPDFQNYETRLLPGTNQVAATIAGYDFTYTVEITQMSSNDSFEYYETADGIIITDCFVYPETLEIPAEIDGKPVVAVASLNGAPGVKHLVFPDSVKTIGDYVLQNLESIETVTFGSGIENLHSEMFLYTYNLNMIEVSAQNADFCTVDGVLYNKAVTRVIAYPICRGNEYVVPNTVTDVSALQDSFYNGLNITFAEGNQHYVTEDGVTYNSDKTMVLFCSKDKAGSYVMPDSVSDIAYSAFAGCSQLTEITISANVTEIVYAAFASCSGLTKVDLPEGLISIGDGAFDNTNSLESIDLPSKLEYIGSNAFYGSGLTAVSIPDSVYMIGNAAFAYSNIQTLDLGNGIVEIYDGAFTNTPVTDVVLPNSLIYLGGGAFNECAQLKTLSIGSGLTSISAYTFSRTALESVNIPSNIQYIDGYAFAYSALQDLILNEGIAYIDEGAFESCHNLTSVTIPSSVKYVDASAFRSCDSLTLLNVAEGNDIYHSDGNCIIITDERLLHIGCGGSVIPIDGSVTEIGVSAFANCNGLNSITIPDTITAIYEYAFYDCESLQTIALPDSVEYLGEEAFRGCDNLTSVSIGDGVSYIGSGVFADCPLTGADLGNAITYIPAYAFQSTQLSTVFMPNTVTEIMYGAFANCTNLTSIELPKSVQSIEEGAFEYCESLTDVYYEGTEADRENMYIVEWGNEYLLNATWHYGWTNENWVVRPEQCKHAYDHKYDAECNLCGTLREVPERPAEDPIFAVGDATARPGDTFTVAVRTDRNTGIVSLTVDIDYDSTVLELVSVEEGDFKGIQVGPIGKQPLSINWVDATNPDNVTNGTVAWLTFLVKEGTTQGTTALSISYRQDDVYDYNMENVPFEVMNGTVTIIDQIAGDANGDGEINNKDIGLMQRYITGWDVEIDADAADVTGDGKVNNKDVGILQRYVNGWGIELN